MAFRLLTNGVIECDTIDELRKLQGHRERKPRSRSDTKPSDLGEMATRFLDLLLKTDKGLNTEEVAVNLGISPKSLPPILRSLAKWSRVKKLDLDGLITRKMAYVNRRPVTVYNLTDHGRLTIAAKPLNGPPVPPKGAPTPANGKVINAR